MTESLGRSSRRPRRRQRGPTSIARVRRGGRIAIVKGQDGSRWTDLYHLILTMSWGTFFVALAGCFLLLDIIFALLYFFSQGLANARPFSFEDCFIFSVQTLGSLSLGGIVPKSGFTKTIAVAEAFIGIVYLGLVTSLMYARFARPFARVLFSNVAIITVFDGTPTLMFRAANQRGNSILDAEAKVTLARRQVTREGIVMRRFEELKLARDRSSLFALSWTIMHRIDETSPDRRISRDCHAHTSAWIPQRVAKEGSSDQQPASIAAYTTRARPARLTIPTREP